MLENVRYEPGETKHDPELVSKLAAVADVYVNDAVGTAHCTHASIESIAHLLPHAARRLMEREVSALNAILEQHRRPSSRSSAAKVDFSWLLKDRGRDRRCWQPPKLYWQPLNRSQRARQRTGLFPRVSGLSQPQPWWLLVMDRRLLTPAALKGPRICARLTRQLARLPRSSGCESHNDC